MPLSRVAWLVVVLLIAGGCTAVPTDITTASTPVEQLDVGLTDFSIIISSASVLAGDVVVAVTNAGATEHDLRITSDTLDIGTQRLAPGGEATLRAGLQRERRLTLFCSLPGHREQGMVTTILVSPASSN